MRYAATLVLALLLLPAARAQEKTFDSGGVKLAYLDQGEGEAVVLLHGFTLSAEEMWTKMPLTETQFLPALKGYRVLALDQRGHGRSGKPHDPKMYGKEMAEDVVRLLDHAKVKKAHVVGYSMGAFVAGKLLVTHPDRLLSVTFGGGGPLFQPPQTFADTITATAESLEKGKGIGPLIVALTPDGQEKPSLEQAAAFSDLFLGKKDQKALAAVLRGRAGWQVTEAELRANKVPVQFVYGSREVQGLKDIIAGSRRALPRAGVVVVEKGDHGSSFATPEFRRAVVDFLRANKE
ncbi:MAG TPA: alpha/beta hydrolase [Urbifossiella sp.]|nr:alpha/beta hydrolase [Urbifossiella sp.]